MPITNELLETILGIYYENSKLFLEILVNRESELVEDQTLASMNASKLAKLDPTLLKIAEQLHYENNDYYLEDSVNEDNENEIREFDFKKARINLKYQYNLMRLVNRMSDQEHIELYAKMHSFPTLQKLYKINLAYIRQLALEPKIPDTEETIPSVDSKLLVLGLDKRNLTHEISTRIQHNRQAQNNPNQYNPDTRSLDMDEHILQNKTTDLDNYAKQIDKYSKILHDFNHYWQEKKYMAALKCESKRLFYYQDIAKFATIHELLQNSHESLKQRAQTAIQNHQDTIEQIKAINLTMTAKKLIANTESPLEPTIRGKLAIAKDKLSRVTPQIYTMSRDEEAAKWNDALNSCLIILKEYCNELNRVYHRHNQLTVKTLADFVPIVKSPEERYREAKKGVARYYTELCERIALYERALDMIASTPAVIAEPEPVPPAKKKQRIS